MLEAEFGEALVRYVPDVDPAVVSRLHRHYELLYRWNERMNLTRVPCGEESVRRHFAESLFLNSLIPKDIETVVDVGSGGGFPGVPISVSRSDLAIDLVDVDVRKCVFLREATADLKNVQVRCGRTEDLSRVWDGVVSRAVNVEEIRKFGCAHGKWIGLLTSVDIAGKFEWSVVTPVPWEPRYAVAELHISRGTHSAG